ncbi:MAG: hypothetical protein V5A72_02690 [Candidatus Nanohaloarchaea archaeon]
MKQLWETSQDDLSDSVFSKRDKTYYCPKCGTKTSGDQRKTFKNRIYSCRSDNCEWEGKHTEVDKQSEPLTDDAVRRILERTVERAGLQGEFKDSPHAFFRKSRAMYKVRIGNTEHQMRAFFGWSKTSDAPKHYIQCVKEDLEKALAEEYGEDVEYENGYDEEALRPVEYIKCGKINSPVNDLCSECGNGLTEQGEELSKSDEKLKGVDESLSEMAEERGIDKEKFSEMLEEKSAIELMMELAG